jgi:ABC-type polysaccharide/polyol phosphate transport system ATPase subunit
MTDPLPAIEFSGVSKIFSRSVGRSLLRDHLTRRLERHRHERFYALKNVSFQIPAGENVAIVGTNGAGKSTLLGLVAGLTDPDTGSVAVSGHVTALLELGSGFHPDLTGVENVFLNASLLGLNREQVRECFDLIVDFSGIGEFIDEPIRTYSTGMILRLAFAVAVNVNPDILLVDEVIAVGDQAFQQKCFDKISEFKYNGKTLICVSHSIPIVQQLCTRALWLDHGELVMDGDIQTVLQAYQGRLAHVVAGHDVP